MTIRDHLIAAARATGKVPEELQLPDVPVAARAIWSTYVELAAQRGAGMSGPQPISLLDVNAWCTRMGVDLVPWEAETLLLMDRAVLHVMAESERARRAQGK